LLVIMNQTWMGYWTEKDCLLL